MTSKFKYSKIFIKFDGIYIMINRSILDIAYNMMISKINLYIYNVESIDTSILLLNDGIQILATNQLNPGRRRIENQYLLLPN